MRVCEGGMRFMWNFGMAPFVTVQRGHFRGRLFTALAHWDEGS